jgi:NAD(P)-dependent dehydrogenase (short-subunit alcohol dehydrogenase family)
MTGRLASKVVVVRRVASAGEIASFVAFLLSDESAFITGAALAIGGGVTAQ